MSDLDNYIVASLFLNLVSNCHSEYCEEIFLTMYNSNDQHYINECAPQVTSTPVRTAYSCFFNVISGFASDLPLLRMVFLY